jgi:diketogulonate reductase-like aldo/keto reductase
MSQFGLGVYQAQNSDETEQAVLHALRSRYRHIGTAKIYRNESDVGSTIERFLQESDKSPDDLWVTFKFFPGRSREATEVKTPLTVSLKRLRLTSMGLYLIHVPTDQAMRIEQWKAIENMKECGLCKTIGVSNYGVHHLQELLSVARYPPRLDRSTAYDPLVHAGRLHSNPQAHQPW